MKKNEIIELNGVEYTLELNRDSFLKIDQYSNIKKSMQIVREDLYEYIDEISEEENPFADEIDAVEIENKLNQKIAVMEKTITRAFWIWLYPNHRLNINQIKEILQPYFEEEDKFEFISEKYSEFLSKSVEIRNNYVEEQKNLKALTNK